MRCSCGTTDDSLDRTASEECTCRVSKTGIYSDSIDIRSFAGYSRSNGSISNISADLQSTDCKYATYDMWINCQLQRNEFR